jgi:hypothetical protein
MKQRTTALCVALGLAVGSACAATMTDEAYQAAEDRIEARYKAESKACDAMRDYDRDVCDALAGGREKVSKAELDARNVPGPEATAKVRRARADAAYDVAKERCADLRGAPRRECRKDAKVVYERAKSQARFDRKRAAEAALRAAAKD